MTRTIRVDLGERSYEIHVGAGLLAQAAERIEAALGKRRLAVVTDANVESLHRPSLDSALRAAGFEPLWIALPPGEEHKDLASLSLVYDRLVRHRFDRGSVLVAFGGGVVGDLAGFAAATFLRGIDHVQIPTTLLAQVDSSIGGKTGINHPEGKNLIGAFYQPRLVLTDVEMLSTLPERELRSGLAEVVKYGAIEDAALFERLEESLEALLAREADSLIEVIAASCRNKARIIQADEREGGYRSVLNFGHTVGHALEALTSYRRFLHGEAVAIGMVQAARISRHYGFCDDATVGRIRKLLLRAGLPVELPPDTDLDSLVRHIEVDKKSGGGKVKFVCCTGIGQNRFLDLAPQEIARALELFRARGAAG
jgi:3-dehydroquinate synthase